ncbi:hypothetical protein ACLOJK_028917 [Asimina triloba]
MGMVYHGGRNRGDRQKMQMGSSRLQLDSHGDDPSPMDFSLCRQPPNLWMTAGITSEFNEFLHQRWVDAGSEEDSAASLEEELLLGCIKGCVLGEPPLGRLTVLLVVTPLVWAPVSIVEASIVMTIEGMIVPIVRVVVSTTIRGAITTSI